MVEVVGIGGGPVKYRFIVDGDCRDAPGEQILSMKLSTSSKTDNLICSFYALDGI